MIIKDDKLIEFMKFLFTGVNFSKGFAYLASIFYCLPLITFKTNKEVEN